MDRFFGFDLGDAESAIARLYKEDQVIPEMIPVAGEKSFITAYAQTNSGEIIIGEKACYADNVVKRKIRFKSRFLTDGASAGDVKRASWDSSMGAGTSSRMRRPVFMSDARRAGTGTPGNITGRSLRARDIRR